MIIAHKGFTWAKITVEGKSAHGSRWDLGVSAISKMGLVLTALDEFEKKVLRQRIEKPVGPASMHVSLIQGGIGVSTYAPSCEIILERRTLPMEKKDEVQAEIEGVIKKVN